MELALGVICAALLLGVLYLIARGADERTSRAQAEELLRQERDRRAKHEEAAEAERRQRAKDFDAKAASVGSPDDGAALLRDELSRFNAD